MLQKKKGAGKDVIPHIKICRCCTYWDSCKDMTDKQTSMALLLKGPCLLFGSLGFSGLWSLYHHPSIGEPSLKACCELCTMICAQGWRPLEHSLRQLA